MRRRKLDSYINGATYPLTPGSGVAIPKFKQTHLRVAASPLGEAGILSHCDQNMASTPPAKEHAEDIQEEERLEAALEHLKGLHLKVASLSPHHTAWRLLLC